MLWGSAFFFCDTRREMAQAADIIDGERQAFGLNRIGDL
jgi:hypothetical protein